jgi:hypothetical protein
VSFGISSRIGKQGRIHSHDLSFKKGMTFWESERRFWSNSRIFGNFPEAWLWKLAIGNHFGSAVAHCPKTFPFRRSQLADSTGVRFSHIAAHNHESVEKVGFFGTDFACRDYPLLCY